MLKVNLSLIKNIWRIAGGYWHSEEKWHALLLLAGVVGLKLGDIYLDVLFNSWRSRFYNTLQNQDKAGFFSALGEWGLFLLAFMCIAVYALYLQQLLENKWRRWMTDHYLTNWLTNRTYYLMQVVDHNADNPDQRISEDLHLFISNILKLSVGLLMAVVRLCSFSVILWNLSGVMEIPWGQEQLAIPGYILWVAFIYTAIGTWLTVKIGAPLISLNFAHELAEANFRYSLVRLRENSEGIAFYKGEQRERTEFMKRFGIIFDNFRGLMLRQKKLSWFTSEFWQTSLLFPYVVAAPRFFSGQIQLGGLMQTVTAFTQVESALAFFINRYSNVAELQASINRLTGFIDNMAQVQTKAVEKKINIIPTTSPVFAVAGLDVVLPTGKLLLSNLEFKIAAGDSLLITGASGCGKSTLLKTLAGIWPFGAGYITIPQDQRLLFLPQKPYLPLGTLREVLLYPNIVEAVPEQKLHEILVMCRLGSLIALLDKAENWSHILSPGEQQRIAFARAITQQPHWLFLDEATSALDEQTEQLMYRLLQEQLPDAAIISVGHRNTLINYHKAKLSIGSGGTWKLAA